MDVSQLAPSLTQPRHVAHRVAREDAAHTRAVPDAQIGAAPSREATGRTASGYSAEPPRTPVDTGAILPPPKAPSAPITARTHAAFASLSEDVNGVLETLQARAPRIDWATLTPEVPTHLSPDRAAERAKTMAQQAAHSVGEIGRQFASLGNQDQLVAFMMLRLQAHSHGLRINEQFADMASAMRHVMAAEQQAHDQASAALLDRAIAQQVRLERAGLWLGGMTALVTSSLAILMTTSGAGLALTIGAIGIGFAAGGVVGGQQNDTTFDLKSAFMGASAGAAVVPFVEMLGLLYGAVGRLAGPQLPGWAGGIAEGAASFASAQTPAAVQAAAKQALGAFEYIFERYVLGIMRGVGPQTRVALWAADPILRSVSGIYQTTASYRMAKIELQGRTEQNLGRICEQAGKQAQERWKNTQNFLSGMQESRNDAVEQVLKMRTMYAQTLLKTSSYIR